MKNIFLTFFAVILCMFITNTSYAQYLNIFVGTKLPEYKNTNIELGYIDESPDPDLFYSNTSLSKKPYYTAGVSYDNFKHEKELYYNAIANVNFGELFGIDLGASVGYPLYLNSSKSISIVPCVTGGFIYSRKGLGELKNNTVYIQVNSTRFADHTNVQINLAKTDLYLKPTVNILFDITKKYQLRLTGSYLQNFDLNKFIEFTGKDNSGKEVSDKEDMDAPNLFYNIDGQPSSTIPFNIKGLEFKLGFAINFGKDKSDAVKK